jgi:hypothetical protein
MSRPLRRQIAEMEVANREQEYAEEVASKEPDQTVQDVLDEARERYAADVERQKLDAQVAAERSDDLEDAIQQEHDEQVEAGEFDEFDSDPRPKPKPQVASAKPKSYVLRKGEFVPAATAYLVPGEKLYRYRPRSMGVSAKFIMFGKVKEENHQ